MARLLDLFCCAGGAGMGYARAGFDVTGVDIRPQPRYPFPFIQANALEYATAHAHEYDAIHASPPCQAYMDTNSNGRKPSKHPRLIEPMRDILIASGKPYVIENVHKAPLKASLMLCGTMFGLRVIRHRYFELSFPAPMSPFSCNHWGTVANGDFVGCYGRGGKGPRHNGIREPRHRATIITMANAMGIDWMSEQELHEAIPPAYTAYVGKWLEIEVRLPFRLTRRIL